MFFLLRLALIVMLLPSMMTFAQHGHETEHPMVYITGVWMQPTSDDVEQYPVNMRIENPSDHTVQLQEVSTSITETATLSGRPGFNILEHGDFIVFGPRTEAYLTLRDIEEDLVAGDAFILTLTFTVLDEHSEETFDVIVGVPVLEEAPEQTPIIVMNAWVRPTLAEAEHHDHHTTPEAAHEMHDHDTPASVTGGFMQLINTGSETETLVAASSEAAMMVEVHETVMNGDLMRMQPVEGIEIPAGEMVEFKSGSYHLMVHLKEEIAPGETILLTLTFESGLEQTIAVPVYDRAFMLLSERE